MLKNGMIAAAVQAVLALVACFAIGLDQDGAIFAAFPDKIMVQKLLALLIAWLAGIVCFIVGYRLNPLTLAGKNFLSLSCPALLGLIFTLFRLPLLQALALPFVEEALGSAPGELWQPGQESEEVVSSIIDQLFYPQNMMVRMREAACRLLNLLPLMELRENHMLRRIYSSRSYGHARELLFIRLAVAGKSLEECEALWPDSVPERGPRVRRKRGRR